MPASDITKETETRVHDAIDAAIESGLNHTQITLPAAESHVCTQLLRVAGYRIIGVEASVLNPGAERVVRFSW